MSKPNSRLVHPVLLGPLLLFGAAAFVLPLQIAPAPAGPDAAREAGTPLSDDTITMQLDGAGVARLPTPDPRAPTRPHEDALVVGRVLDRGGAPAAGLAVNLTSLRGGEGPGVATWPHASELLERQTDADGRFEITGITAGSYLLSVRHVDDSETLGRNLQFGPEDLRVIEVGPGSQRIEVRLSEWAGRRDEEHDCTVHGHGAASH